ncbi:MAG: SRPBCC domain-containing protein [Acidobacteriales bacterium]|nr:SRPBCC domain-containing protein [Terriglobales bacterium]
MEDQFQQGELNHGAQVSGQTLADIEQQFVYKVEPQLAFLALSQDIHLTRWWCEECSVEARSGGRVRLFFEGNVCQFEITEFISYQFMEWKCMDARNGARTREDWVGSMITFQISRSGDRGTELRLVHRNVGSPAAREEWASYWRRYMGNSLKTYLEFGVGQPALRSDATPGL